MGKHMGCRSTRVNANKASYESGSQVSPKYQRKGVTSNPAVLDFPLLLQVSSQKFFLQNAPLAEGSKSLQARTLEHSQCFFPMGSFDNSYSMVWSQTHAGYLLTAFMYLP